MILSHKNLQSYGCIDTGTWYKGSPGSDTKYSCLWIQYAIPLCDIYMYRGKAVAISRTEKGGLCCGDKTDG